jgi:F-type H+/Na+-transporting ATPase subunit alpha
VIQTAIDYAKELHKAGMTHEELSSVKDIFDVVPQVKEELNDPTVSLEKKHLVIQKVFSKNVRNFLQLLCDNNDVNLFEEVYKALTELEKTPEQKESSAVLTYVEAPSDEQLAGIKKFIEKEFHNPDIKLEMVKDPSLKSGFVLKVGSKEYDWSEKARIDQLKSSIAKAVGTGSATASEKGILSILEANIEDFQLEVKDKEIGVVNWVGDGIANVDGIDHAFYGEIVICTSHSFITTYDNKCFFLYLLVHITISIIKEKMLHSRKMIQNTLYLILQSIEVRLCILKLLSGFSKFN